tara:strand:- start:69017 stop:69757 length:741 start_codon:yes stop_codon:yes gene_type:complete
MANVNAGDKIKSNNFGWFEVIELLPKHRACIRFEGFNSTVVACRRACMQGSVKNRYAPSVCGIGYLGYGKHKPSTNKSKSKSYVAWSQMIQRCYAKGNRNESYIKKGAFVCNEWLNYQAFADWFCKNYVDDFRLDKDLTVMGNVMYAPQLCSYIPSEVNLLLGSCNKSRGEWPVGVSRIGKWFRCDVNLGEIRRYTSYHRSSGAAFDEYKTIKESHVKKTAEEYKQYISSEIYNNLKNWIAIEYPE